MHAAGALGALARDVDNRRTIGEADAVGPLLKLLGTDHSEQVQQQAVSALANLTANTQTTEEFMSAVPGGGAAAGAGAGAAAQTAEEAEAAAAKQEAAAQQAADAVEVWGRRTWTRS